MNLVITIIIFLGFSFILERLGRKINIPSVVSLIIAGLIIGMDFFKSKLIGQNISFIFILGNIGLFVLMFFAGLETSAKMLKKEEKDSFYIAIFGFFVPFLLGFSIFLLLGFSILVSLIVGLCMSITAEATKARVLLEIKKLKTRVGSAMMGAGIVDDFLGLIIFLIISFFNGFKSSEAFITLGVIFVFFLGIFVQKFSNNSFFRYFKKFLFLFVPFFFISIGLHFDFKSLILNPFLLVLIVVLAFSGKMFGVLFAKKFTHFKLKQLFLIGWAMNSRGAIELALALLAFNQGILNVELYSSIVIMALITTLVFPFIITQMVKKKPKIMN